MLNTRFAFIKFCCGLGLVIFTHILRVISPSLCHWDTVRFTMMSSNGNISALLSLCEGNPPVTRAVTQSFDVFFDLRRLSKESRRHHHSAHYDVTVMFTRASKWYKCKYIIWDYGNWRLKHTKSKQQNSAHNFRMYPKAIHRQWRATDLTHRPLGNLNEFSDT